MACGGCNSEASMTKSQVENLISQLIREGVIQGGLKGCDGSALSAGTKLAMCSDLSELSTELKAEIDKVKQKLLDLGIKSVSESDKAIIITRTDGSSVTIPKDALTADSFDNTIKKGTNQEGKYGVNLADKGGLDFDKNGGISVQTGAGLKKDPNGNIAVKTGNGLKTNDQGELTINGSQIGAAVGEGLAGNGIKFENGQLHVGTVRLMDASGTVHLGNLVDLGA